jgi:hypothetical protein
LVADDLTALIGTNRGTVNANRQHRHMLARNGAKRTWIPGHRNASTLHALSNRKPGTR